MAEDNNFWLPFVAVPYIKEEYPTGIIVSKLSLKEGDHVFDLKVKLCPCQNARPPDRNGRISLFKHNLQSQAEFERGLDHWCWYEFYWPYQEGTDETIDRKFLQYHLHAPKLGDDPCPRRLLLADFLKGGQYEVRKKEAQDTVFDVHVCPRPGFQGELRNGPDCDGRPNVTVHLPSGQWVSAQSPHAVAFLDNGSTNPTATAASSSSAANNSTSTAEAAVSEVLRRDEQEKERE